MKHPTFLQQNLKHYILLFQTGHSFLSRKLVKSFPNSNQKRHLLHQFKTFRFLFPWNLSWEIGKQWWAYSNEERNSIFRPLSVHVFNLHWLRGSFNKKTLKKNMAQHAGKTFRYIAIQGPQKDTPRWMQCPNGLVWRWGHPESSFMGVAPSTFHLLPLITTHPEGIFWSLQLQVTPY